MLNTTISRNRFPFTATQWQELEHQALIYKYMVSGVPVPPELLYSVKRSLGSSLASRLFPHQPSKLICTYCFECFFLIYKKSKCSERKLGLCFRSWVGLFSGGFWQKSRPRARKVQKNGWKKMEVLKGSIPRLKILWEAHAQRQKPFKKACGTYFKYYYNSNNNSFNINQQKPL